VVGVDEGVEEEVKAIEDKVLESDVVS